MPRQYAKNRPLTCQAGPVVSVTTQLDRPLAEQFTRKARSLGLTNGAMIRELVQRWTSGSDAGVVIEHWRQKAIDAEAANVSIRRKLLEIADGPTMSA